MPETDAGKTVFAIVPVTVRNGQKRQVASCRMRTRLGLWVANGCDGTEMPTRELSLNNSKTSITSKKSIRNDL